MKTVPFHEAEATLSALVDDARRGEPTMITRDGEPTAVLVSVLDAAKLEPEAKLTFAEMLMTIPHELPYERDTRPMRVIDFDSDADIASIGTQ